MLAILVQGSQRQADAGRTLTKQPPWQAPGQLKPHLEKQGE